MATTKKATAKLTKPLVVTHTPKKSPAKKATIKESAIKYEDKSTGQPQLVPIFQKIKGMLKPYVKGNIKAQDGTGGMYNLVSTKQVEVMGKIRELFFASAMVQKGFVGFYFFPIYTDPEIGKELQPELLKCLKGKSCFHIKKDDEQLMEQIQQALEAGYKLYSSKGWI